MTDSTTRTPGAAATDNPTTDDNATAAAPEAATAADVAELKDKLLRALAEAENTRRRAERDVADARLYGITAFARDILAVADNMHRAIEAFGPEREKADAGLKALIEGVELTERELLNVLTRYGVKKIDPVGQKFDPHFHQAMFELPDESVPAGTVVQVVQSGYTIGDRVLRPAMVGIAKGGPKPAAAGETPANDNPGK